MPTENKPTESNNNAPKKKPGCLILIILILIFFFWHFINYTSMNWIGNIENTNLLPRGNQVEISPTDMPSRKTTTEYNDAYLRWAGTLNPGESALWGKITIQQPEIPVGGIISPLAPCRIYGNLREVNGIGVEFMVMNEVNYNNWIRGANASAMIYQKDLRDYDYSFGIDTGVFYIIVKNSSRDQAAQIGFTGVHVYQRRLSAGEVPMDNLPAKVYWNYKQEKLTLFQYLIRLFGSPYNVPVTPPSIVKR